MLRFVLGFVFFATTLAASAAPVLSSISPTSGYPGTQVTYTGTGFGATQGSGSVWLGNKLAGSIVSWSNTQIVATVAATAASGSAQVQQGGTWSNSIAFTVIKPNITSVSPTSAYPGAQVTINGTNFGATQGSGSVWLGNKLAGSIVSWSATQIVATVASTALSGSVQVQQMGVWSNSIAFTVITPNISSVTPTTAYPGAQVTLNGTNFGATQGTGSVWLGNKFAGSIVSWSNTQIVATVAATAASGSAQVQQGGVWSNSVAFTVITPSLTSINPATARAGDSITLTGTNFGASQGTGSVWLGSKLAGSIVSWSNTQIVATVDSGSISGNAIVQQGGVWSHSIALTVLTPQLTSIAPETGRAGDSITLTGTNFGASQGSGSVWLGTKLAGSIVSWSDTEIVATINSGSITGTAQVQQGGVWTNSIALEVITPQLGSTYPSIGAPGTQVEIWGAGFGATQGTGRVWLGSQYADVVSWSDEMIVATVAAGSANGTVQIFQGGVWSDPHDFPVTCVEPRADAPETDPLDRPWVDDDFLRHFSGSWSEWDTTQSANGTQSFHAYGGYSGLHRTYMFDSFSGAKINPGDSFLLNFMIDECNTTEQVLITLVHNSGTGETLLTWGGDPLEAGPNAIDMGALPPPGQWERVEIPFQDLGLEGAMIFGIIYDNYDGVVWFDYTGKKASNPAPAHILSITPSSEAPYYLDDELTFTVAASGAGPIEYRFRQSIPGTFQYTLLQDWSTSNTLDWTVPYSPGYHFWIYVDVRNAGSTEVFEDVDYYSVRVECVTATAPPVSIQSGDQITIDDGAGAHVTTENLTFTTAQKTLGTSSFTTTVELNSFPFAPVSFSGLQNELPADPDESIVFYVLVDECLSSLSGITVDIETAPDTEHPTPVSRRVYFVEGEPFPARAGDLPPYGVWTRLEIPQSMLDFGFTPTAYGKISFRSYGKRVWYDALGTTDSQ